MGVFQLSQELHLDVSRSSLPAAFTYARRQGLPTPEHLGDDLDNHVHLLGTEPVLPIHNNVLQNLDSLRRKVVDLQQLHLTQSLGLLLPLQRLERILLALLSALDHLLVLVLKRAQDPVVQALDEDAHTRDAVLASVGARVVDVRIFAGVEFALVFAQSSLVVIGEELLFAAGGFVGGSVGGVLGLLLGEPVEDVGVGEADGAWVEDCGHVGSCGWLTEVKRRGSEDSISDLE
jgi:hypothetical protein